MVDDATGARYRNSASILEVDPRRVRPGKRKRPSARAFARGATDLGRRREWAILDSNQGPLPYQRSALTD
jgi:hypothetical protein